MNVIFDRSHVTVCDVQDRCCQHDSLQACIEWLLSYLSSADAHRQQTCSLTDVDLPNRDQVYTN